jgi:hypothetical protein
MNAWRQQKGPYFKHFPFAATSIFGLGNRRSMVFGAGA